MTIAANVTCLCLETFAEGSRGYIHLTPPQTLDNEGRVGQTSMVCCNDCWKGMPMCQRALLSILTTPAEDGGLLVGPLLHDRFWPEIMRPFFKPPSSGSTPFSAADPDTQQDREEPPGAAVSRMRDARKTRREGE